MAKVAFSKLKCKINETEVTVPFGEETIIVKQYLPIQEKLILIGYVVQMAHDQDYNFCNPVKVQVFKELEMLQAYTNINFTDKQKEDRAKLYDLVTSSGLLEEVLKAIPVTERLIIDQGVESTTMALYQYQNSALGVIDAIKTNYDDIASAANFAELSEQVMDPEALTLLKDILTKTS